MINIIRRLQNRLFRILLLITSDPFRVAQLWRQRGIDIGEGTCIYHDVVLDAQAGMLSIGKNCVLTGCTILTHDASTNKLLGLKYGEPSIIKPVIIEDDCFIGYGSIILMGIKIGRGSIVGAGAVVTRDISPNVVVAGNPARAVCTVGELVERRIQLIRDNPEIFPAGVEKLNPKQEGKS